MQLAWCYLSKKVFGSFLAFNPTKAAESVEEPITPEPKPYNTLTGVVQGETSLAEHVQHQKEFSSSLI